MPKLSRLASRRLGVSLVEVLVVVGIVGLLVSLLAPAVGVAREASRRALCLAKLRQIGLALHAYHGDFSALPPACHNVLDPRYGNGASAFRDRSTFVFLLPYLEQTALADAQNHRVSVLAPENRTVVQTPLAVYACPSDGRGGLPIPSGGIYPPLFAPGLPAPSDIVTRASFAVCAGSVSVNDFPEWYPGGIVPANVLSQFDGCFNCWRSTRFQDVLDGLAKTMFAAEMTDPVYCGGPGENSGVCQRANWWCEGRFGGAVFNAMAPPNRRGTNTPLAGAGSIHEGGLHILLGDGSAMFIGNGVHSWAVDGAGSPIGATYNPATGWVNLPPNGIWQAYATRAGNESMSMP